RRLRHRAVDEPRVPRRRGARQRLPQAPPDHPVHPAAGRVHAGAGRARRHRRGRRHPAAPRAPADGPIPGLHGVDHQRLRGHGPLAVAEADCAAARAGARLCLGRIGRIKWVRRAHAQGGGAGGADPLQRGRRDGAVAQQAAVPGRDGRRARGGGRLPAPVRVRAVLGEPRLAVLIPPGVGGVPAAAGGAVCGVALQELAQRPAADERRAGAPGVRAAAAHRPGRRQPARAAVRDPSVPGGRDLAPGRHERAGARRAQRGRPDPVAGGAAVPGRGLCRAVGRARRAHRHAPGLRRHGLRLARAGPAARLLPGPVLLDARGRGRGRRCRLDWRRRARPAA
ncbi:hypothetical protein IWW47_006246, partial [Coemansia sp. RSA 2052]